MCIISNVRLLTPIPNPSTSLALTQLQLQQHFSEFNRARFVDIDSCRVPGQLGLVPLHTYDEFIAFNWLFIGLFTRTTGIASIIIMCASIKTNISIFSNLLLYK